jgi:copper(I)-binding protein
MRRFRLAMPLAAAALAACQAPAERAVEDAWARLPAALGRPAAAYLTLKGGASGATLVGIESPAAARAELHEMANDNGVMRMGAVAKIDVPAGGEVRLAPGGLHVMLFGVKPGMQPGGTIPLTLRFADASSATVEARLIGAGDPAPE